MPTQLPNLFINALPLALSTVMAMAALGLAYSLCAFIFRGNAITPVHGDPVLDSRAARVVWKVMKVSVTGFWLILTSLHVMAWQFWFSGESEQLNGISYLSSFIAILLGWQLWRNSRATLWASSPQWHATGTIGLQALQIVGLSYCSSLLSAQPATNLALTAPGTLVACQTAHTDLGTPVRLYDRQVESSELEKFYSTTRSQILNLARLAMFRSEPGHQINCHGWVFNGQHIIKCEDVPLILKENGYAEVNQPKMNDLVVYTDASGTVVHTGIVRGFLGENSPLIESKWGITGIYVHLVDEQPYSLAHRFYRSAREGHHLRYGEPNSEALAEEAHSMQELLAIGHSS